MQANSIFHNAYRTWLSWLICRLPDLIRCTHPHLKLDEGKCYCPDCGDGLIFKWVFIRCNGCQHRRNSISFWEQIAPQHPFCPECGERGWHLQYLEQPEFFQLHSASLVLLKEDSNKIKIRLDTVTAWVERVSPSVQEAIPQKLGLELLTGLRLE
jgi:hypothetical protein